MNIAKTGQLNTLTITEQHIETVDNSKWELVFVHNRPCDYHFDANDPFTTGFSTNMNLYFNFNVCNSLTSWEFLIIQADTYRATPQKRRWVQTANPLTAAFADVAANTITHDGSAEYTSDSWGGLYKINNANTFLCANNGTNGNWWGATGSKVFYQGGIPAWYGKIVKDGYVVIYVRVDGQNQDHAKFYKNGIIHCDNFYEY